MEMNEHRVKQIGLVGEDPLGSINLLPRSSFFLHIWVNCVTDSFDLNEKFLLYQHNKTITEDIDMPQCILSPLYHCCPWSNMSHYVVETAKVYSYVDYSGNIRPLMGKYGAYMRVMVRSLPAILKRT